MLTVAGAVLMTFFLLLPTILSFLVLGAHYLRMGMTPVTLLCILAIGLLAIKQKWAARVVQVLLLLAATEWIRTLAGNVNQRIADGQPWQRMAIILGVVAAIAIIAAGLFETSTVKKRYIK